MSGLVLYNQNDAVEQCRDFLRTGRCKYGASCKFDHPSNVQSGGGIKAPVDPSEPQFPVRPNEPVCQYYTKHGTCKFGQACKFNHPPQSALCGVGGGKPGLSQVPQNIVMEQAGGGDQTIMLQLLPQRPDEPDCIYFLRNGRCKYGATCRYHHPVNYQQRKLTEHGRRQVHSTTHVSNDGTVMQSQLVENLRGNVQYVTTQRPQMGYSQQRVVQTSSGAHVLVQETPVTVIHVNSTGQQSYRQVHVSQGRDYNEVGMEYQTPIREPLTSGTGLSRERATSSSSLASSYGTAYDHPQELSAGDNGFWNVSNSRSFSGGNLSSNDLHQQRNQQTSHGGGRVAPNSSDSNFAFRRSRAASLGSTGDHSQYHDASNGIGWSNSGHPQSLPSHFETQTWIENSLYDSTDQLYRSRNQAFSNQGRYDGYEDDRHQYLPDHSRHQPPRQLQSSGYLHDKQHQQQHHGGVDQGLSMMTDALLTMLDTPEDLSKGKMRQSTSFSTVPTVTSPTSTPQSVLMGTPQEPVPLDDSLMPPWAGNQIYPQDGRATLVYTTSGPSYQNQSMSSLNEEDPPHSFSSNAKLSVGATYFSNGVNQYEHHSGIEKGLETRWSPSWQEHLSLGQHLDQNAQGMSVLQSRQSGPSSPNSSDVGLYLP